MKNDKQMNVVSFDRSKYKPDPSRVAEFSAEFMVRQLAAIYSALAEGRVPPPDVEHPVGDDTPSMPDAIERPA